jgi:hypothetical protein
VASDTRLRADDPVVLERCELDGLAIRADRLAETITLDLDGNTIAGTGAGIGIRIDHGGADGARIVGARPGARGIVRGFATGISTSAGDALALVARVEVRDNRHEGLRIVSAGTVLDDVAAYANGTDGIYVRGTGGRLIGVESTGNRGSGIRLFGSDAAVDAAATDNGDSGIVVGGQRNDVSRASATGNARHGIVVRGRSDAPPTSRASGNRSDDVRFNGLRIEP